MLKQPVGVIQMTNVAIIRYRLNNLHFEIACYKNKAINWRNGIEKDLREVLQIDKIFTSASHGQEASQNELKWYFPGMSKTDIIKTILEKGDLQLGDKEREIQINQLYKGIVKFIQEKCVHPVSKRPFNQQSIEHAISKINFIVRFDQPMKKQALTCIRRLREQFYIERAEMLVGVTIDESDRNAFLEVLKNLKIQIEKIKTDKGNKFEIIIDPSKFRPLSIALKDQFKKSSIEVVEANISNKEVEDIQNADTVELEMRKEKLQLSEEESDEEDQKSKQKGKNKDKKNKDKDKKNKGQKEKDDEGKGTTKTKEKTNGKDSEAQQQQIQQQAQAQSKKEDLASDNKKFKCNTCPGAAYDNNADFRAHYKCDWHAYNLKQKNKDKPTLDNEQYLEKVLEESLNL